MRFALLTSSTVNDNSARPPTTTMIAMAYLGKLEEEGAMTVTPVTLAALPALEDQLVVNAIAVVDEESTKEF